MMKIAIFFTEPLLDAGGVGRVSEILASEFQKLGHECVFLALQGNERRKEPTVRQAIFPDPNPQSTAARLYLRNFIEKNDVDVLINQAAFNLDTLSLVKSVSAHVRVIHVHHNCIKDLIKHHTSIISAALQRGRFSPRFLPSFMFSLLRKRAQRRFTRAIRSCTSDGDHLAVLFDAFRDEACSIAGPSAENHITAIPNPSPYMASPETLSRKRKKILFVGRIEYAQKRIDRLCRIWESVSESLPEWTLEIVGDGPDAERLWDWSRKTGVERARYHGFQDPRRFFEESSIFLLTSDFEGFGMVLVEAQALGCVPIATRSFSAIDSVVLPGESGLLYAPCDEQGICRGVRALADDRALRERMAKAGFRHIKQYDASRIASRWLTLFDSTTLKNSERSQKSRRLAPPGSLDGA